MAERRRAPRLKLLKPVQAKVRTYALAKVLDVSESGLLLEIEHALSPGDRHQVRIQVEGGDEVLRATVRRCWLERTDRDAEGLRVRVYHAGLEFEKPDPDLLDRLPGESLVKVHVEFGEE